MFFDMQVHSDEESLQGAFQQELLTKTKEYVELKKRYDELSQRIQVEKQLSYEAGYNKALYQLHNININQKMSSNHEERC